MSDESGKLGPEMEPLLAEVVDRVCDEFEAAWSRGEHPRIEAMLVRVPGGSRDRLFRKLLEIELQLRQRSSEVLDSKEYTSRFPDHLEAVDSLFRRLVRRRLGDYEILQEIGRGGMGVVYKAQHVFLRQTVALKVLPERYLDDRQAVQRFRREMLSIGNLSHANIVRALNAGEERGVQYLATEFVDGCTLHDLVARRGCLPVGLGCELIRQAAVGLQYVHENGLVHRDIKPANLILSREGVVKVLDLGLARLADSPITRELSQKGVAMGTLDYMAPEQWEDPSSVDIRADIYSLGCTLFHLLTGMPPYAGTSCVGMREKLVAHLVADTPRLSEHVPDCPMELEHILSRLLAKKADDRFGTPGEVADAIGHFADRGELVHGLPYLSATSHDANHASAPALRGSTAEVRRRANTASARRSASATTGSSWRSSWRQALLWGAAGAVLVLAMILIAGRIDRATSPNLPRIVRPREAVVSEPSPAAIELCTLPGLNGRWWLEETPWLMPFVRQAIAEKLTAGVAPSRLAIPVEYQANPALDPNTQRVQDWLLELVSQSRELLSLPQRNLLDAMVEVSRKDLSDEELAALLRVELNRFCVQAALTKTSSSVDLHTRAVMEHWVASIASDLELTRRAAVSYDAALVAYSHAAGLAGPLRSLCLVDWGRLHATVLADYPEAKRRFREARTVPGTPDLLLAEAWIDEGIASAGANRDTANKYVDASHAFTAAQELLADSTLGTAHPILAHIHERFAWMLMDQWNVSRANDEFKEARNIRFDNFWKSKNPFAQIFVFHNEHGQAMAERYCGDDKLARAQYDLVIGGVERASKEAEAQPERPGLQRYRRDLRERFSNSCERRADCELYGGAASGGAVDLKEAARLYAVARDKADDPPARVAMACKRSIVLAMDNRLEQAEQELGQKDVTGRNVIGVSEERVRLLRKLAQAVLTAKKVGPAEGQSALRSFLRDFDLDPNYPDRHRRETQELQLFAAEMLIASQLRERSSPEAGVADVAYLDKLISAFPYRDQMLKFLRRYYDLAIEAVADIDPDRATSYILASRGQRPETAATMVLFHLQEKRGWGIVRPVDSAGVSFPLPFGREDVKTAAASTGLNGGPTLPKAMLDRIGHEKNAGHALIVRWDDAACWSRPEDALRDQDWPFGSQWELPESRQR